MKHSCGPVWLDKKIADRQMIVIDGAMGTELEARGAKMHDMVWSAAAVLTNPEAVRGAHMDYIKAGAEVIITNTFSAGRHMLEPAGLGAEFERLNCNAVQLAKEARLQAGFECVAIAGSICEWTSAGGQWAGVSKLRDCLFEQAEILAREGVDLITVEMGERPESTAIALEAALATGLPVWAGLSCKIDEVTGDLGGFDDLKVAFKDVVQCAVEQPIAMINIMHSAIADTPAGLQCVRDVWPGPLGVYPESGYFKMPNWQFEEIISPVDLVKEAKSWLSFNVQLVGGCCGLSVAHIAALREAFPR